MRLKVITQQGSPSTHSASVVALNWTTSNELFSCGDDKLIHKWNMDSEPLGLVTTLETTVTDMHWCPTKGKSRGMQGDLFVVSCTDGSFKIISKGHGRIEKVVEKAHVGAVTAIRWNYEGTSIITAGEDGDVKVWSKTGMLRSTLLRLGVSVYSLVWSPNNDSILFSVGKELVIKPLQASSKQMQWKAHDGVVLKVDWNPVNNWILSGGEDCRYRIWDAYGRPLFSSEIGDNFVTSVSWCPDGQLFCIGSFNTLKLCDKTGWCYSRERINSGSIFGLAWTSDGTLIAAGGGSGAVCFCSLVDREFEWQNISAKLDENNVIQIQDVNSEAIEELPFRDRVVKMSIGFDHVVVATSTQCHIFNTIKWGTPIVFDIKDVVNLIVQCEKYFLTVDNFNGIQLYSYEARLCSNPKYAGLRIEFLNEQTISLSNDFLAIVDQTNRSIVHFLDPATGRILGAKAKHTHDLLEIHLNQFGPSVQRKLAVVDKNHDLWISPVLKPRFMKMGSMIGGVQWNDKTDMLATVMDGNFVVWFYPAAVFFDSDLMSATKETKDGEYGSNARVVHFFGKTCTVRRADGALLSCSISPYPALLYENAAKGDWENAVRLCRFVRDPTLWACLAAMSLDANDLQTSEVAFAAIEQIDKLKYVVRIREMPVSEVRTAELFLLKRQPREAETVLLQAGLYWRAINLNLVLFNWERALTLAQRHSTHIDTVVAYRRRYLERFRKTEKIKEFLKLADLQCDWSQIKDKIRLEKENELKGV